MEDFLQAGKPWQNLGWSCKDRLLDPKIYDEPQRHGVRISVASQNLRTRRSGCWCVCVYVYIYIYHCIYYIHVDLSFNFYCLHPIVQLPHICCAISFPAYRPAAWTISNLVLRFSRNMSRGRNCLQGAISAYKGLYIRIV